MFKKISATMLALTMALGLALATAPTSQAVEAGKYEVQNLGGYQGGKIIAVQRVDGIAVALRVKPANGWVVSGAQGSNISPKRLTVQPNTCVWEEVWGNFGNTWYGNFNYYNRTSAAYNVDLEGSKLREANGIESRLRIIQC